jgi:murein DD-endopeptidase MepM/ murein hydrolase activator NlpD
MATHRAEPTRGPNRHRGRDQRAHSADPRHRAQPAPPHRTTGLVAVVAVAALAAAGGSDLVGTPSASPTPFRLTRTATTAATAVSIAEGTDAVGWTDRTPESERAIAVSRGTERKALQVSRKAAEVRASSWHLPTRGYHLTARFGQVSGLWATVHTGLDFAAPTGTPIFAVASGVITQTGWDGSYGNKTVEKLPDGTDLWYAHQSEIGVKVGQRVSKGATIGEVGSTGNTTGPHVHLEVRPHGGDPVDPYAALIAHGVHP